MSVNLDEWVKKKKSGLYIQQGFSDSSVGKEPTCSAGDAEELGSIPGSEAPLEEGTATHSISLPGEAHGQRSLAGYSPQGRKVSDMTEATEHLHTSQLQALRVSESCC